MTHCTKCNRPTKYINSLGVQQTVCDICFLKEERGRWYIVKSLERKLRKLNIDVDFEYNVPWIYLARVNGVRVKERFNANHGFTAFYYPVAANKSTHFSDLKYVFKKIRQMVEGNETFPDGYEEYENRN